MIDSGVRVSGFSGSRLVFAQEGLGFGRVTCRQSSTLICFSGTGRQNS